MSITRYRPIVLVLFGTCLAASSGCNTTPHLNDSFGDSVRANLSAQVLDPLAVANANPALGIDGAAARATQERYQRSFKDADTTSDQPLVGRTQQ